MDDDSTFVRITNRDIWNKLVELEKDFEEIKPVLLDVHENKRRTRALELKVYAILAGLTTTASAAGLYLVAHL